MTDKLLDAAARPADTPAGVLDARSQAVADRLHARADAQRRSLLRRYLPRLPAMLLGRPIDFTRGMDFYDDKLIPIDPAQGRLLYMLARARRARCVVEFGTSFGVSTLYLAAAMRDGGSGGRVIGTELVAAKVAAARANLVAAGLAAQVEIREGDALQTLRQLPEEVDLLLLDGWPSLADEVLALVEPRLADGALVAVDNLGHFRGNLRALLARLARSPRYRACRLPLNGGMLLASFSK